VVESRLAEVAILPLDAALSHTVVTMVDGGRDEESGEYPPQISTPHST
jgi:hypothetical protein